MLMLTLLRVRVKGCAWMVRSMEKVEKVWKVMLWCRFRRRAWCWGWARCARCARCVCGVWIGGEEVEWGAAAAVEMEDGVEGGEFCCGGVAGAVASAGAVAVAGGYGHVFFIFMAGGGGVGGVDV